MSRKTPSGEQAQDEETVKAVERAMVAIRRSQTRRALNRLAEGRDAADSDVVGSPAVDVLDAIDAAEQAGTPATVSSVATNLNVDQPRASKLVAAAVEAGLVRREADQADGRRAHLVRTDSGDALFEELHRHRRSIFASAMSGWNAAERATFANLLTSFVESLAGITERGGQRGDIQ